MGDFLATTIPHYLMIAASSWAHWGGGKTAWVFTAMLAILCPLCCMNEREISPLTWKKHLWLFVMSAVPLVALTVVQYIVSTPVGADSVAGMQGRYVLPVMPLLALTLMLPQSLRRRVAPAGRWVALAAALIALGCIYADGWQIIMVKMQGVMPG